MREFTVNNMEISAAHRTCRDFNEDLGMIRNRCFPLNRFERLAYGLKHHCLHESYTLIALLNQDNRLDTQLGCNSNSGQEPFAGGKALLNAMRGVINLGPMRLR